VIGITKSQSPLCGEEAAEKEARWNDEFKMTSAVTWSVKTPELLLLLNFKLGLVS